MELRDYQSEAVEFLIPRRRGMIVAPAGSGKTVIGAHALSRVLKPGMKVLWLANTLEQCAQAGEAIQRTPGPENVDITISCAAGAPETTGLDVIVIDECHHACAQSWLRIIVAAGNVRVIGLTATPWHSDEERNIVVREIFKEFFVIERDRVLASGHLVHGKVWMYDVDRPGEFDEEIGRLTAIEVARRVRAFRNIPLFEHQRRAQWQISQQFVQANVKRNSEIVRLASQESGNGASVLLLIGSIEHGTLLAERIGGAQLIHSKLSKKKRAQAIDDFRSGALKVAVCSSLADEGMDIPRAEVLILAAGGRSAGKLEQRAGRVLRPFEGKKAGTIFDFLDRGSIFAHAQARSRMQTYEKLGYEPDIVKA